MFCPNCGNKLPDHAKFCDNCGDPVGNVPNKQASAQAPVSAQAIRAKAKSKAKAKAKQAAAAVSQLRPGVAEAVQTPLSALSEQIAASQPGEAVLGTFGGASDAAAGVAEIMDPFKTALSGIKALVQNIVGLFRNKQRCKLITAGVIALVWLVLMILSHYGINFGLLNWLTFAQGGAGRSVSGWIGGLLGKTTVVATAFSLFSGGFRSLGRGFKPLCSGANFKTNHLGSLLLGAGGALIVYQFFAGNASVTDTMPAISGALLSVMALGRGDGFWYRFAQSLTASKAGSTRVANREKVNVLLSGVTYGFALGALASAIPFGRMPVVLGGVCLIAAIVLGFVRGNRKEMAE